MNLPPEAVPHPPMVMRLYSNDTENEPKKGRVFLFNDWYYGKLNHLTATISERIVNVAERLGKTGKVKMVTLPLDEEYMVTVGQLKGSKDLIRAGSVVGVLYISAEDLEVHFGRESKLYGPFTKDFMNLLTVIAIRINSTISAMHCSPDGDIMVMFSPHDPEFDLESYFNEYYDNDQWMTPEKDDGDVHHSDSPT